MIYALILGDVEAKTYEYGMLRALGLPHNTLSAVLCIQTAAFSIPGILLGLIIASVLHIVVVVGVAAFASVDTLVLVMPTSAWIYGIVLGIVIPAVANIVPIRRALTNTLRDALDLYHSSTQDVIVKVQNLAKLGLSPTQVCFLGIRVSAKRSLRMLPLQLAVAILLVVIGFVTYYLVPLAFVLRDFALFLGVLNGILLAMLLGSAQC